MRMRYVRSRRKDKTPVLRLEPEKRLCPLFDPVTIAEFPVAEPGEMGYRVLDNFCEEHIDRFQFVRIVSRSVYVVFRSR